MKMRLVSSLLVGSLNNDLLAELLVRLPAHCLVQLRPCLEFVNLDDVDSDNHRNSILSIYSSDEDFDFLDWYESI